MPAFDRITLDPEVMGGKPEVRSSLPMKGSRPESSSGSGRRRTGPTTSWSMTRGSFSTFRRRAKASETKAWARFR